MNLSYIYKFIIKLFVLLLKYFSHFNILAILLLVKLVKLGKISDFRGIYSQFCLL